MLYEKQIEKCMGQLLGNRFMACSQFNHYNSKRTFFPSTLKLFHQLEALIECLFFIDQLHNTLFATRYCRMVIVGFQFVFFTGFARIYAVTHLGENDQKLERLFRYVTIEKAGVAGIVAALAGMGIYAWIFVHWIHSGFGSLDEVKNSIIALTLIVLGIETISSAFMLSILGIKEK